MFILLATLIVLALYVGWRIFTAIIDSGEAMLISIVGTLLFIVFI